MTSAGTEGFFKICLEEELTRRCEKNPKYSIRAFARAAGMDPTALSRILSERKVPSLQLAKKLLSILHLNPEEEERFWASLAQTHQAKAHKRLSPFFKKKAPQEIPVRDLTGDWYRVVSDWYHYVILEMALIPGAKNDSAWIAAELGITQAEAKLALDRLIRLELLEVKNDKLVRVDSQMTTADKGLTNSALIRRQKQILEKATASLENDPIEVRSHTSMTMAIDPRRLPEAKALIREFNKRMSELLETGKRSEVYEVAVSLFPIQRRRSKQ